MEKTNLHKKLYDAFVKAHPGKRGKECQSEVNTIWRELKTKTDVEAQVNMKIQNYNLIVLQKKAKLNCFWAGLATKSPSLQMPNETSNQSNSQISAEATIQKKTPEAQVNLSELSESDNSNKSRTIAQDDINKQINILNSDLIGLYKRKESGLLSSDQEKDLKQKKLDVEKLQKTLSKKIYDQVKQREFRKKKKEILEAACEDNPALASKLKIRHKVGRPAIEEDQPLLLKTIVDIAVYGSAAHEKRQSDIYRSIKTLDDLTKELKQNGFHLSRSTVYTRLIPKRSLSLEGKRHITTVPVRLIRSQNDSHSKHMDGRFCASTLHHLEEIASLLGPSEICFLSQDDKARVPIGLTAANKQAPLLMHVEYKVTLPDHDWIVAAKHKLIPSVYAGIDIRKDSLGKPDAVGYSGPTYIAIGSGKHSSSTAYSHALDFERLLNIEEFDLITKDPNNNLVKPILIFSVDGGPDENPRYQKVIDCAINTFIKHDLDALFIATNAPKRSAFNRVERRMAPLSKELSGLILPHDFYGTHLDSQGNTVDLNLEKLNFKKAGDTLAEIWSAVTIDNFSTVAEYIDEEKSEILPDSMITKTQNWWSKHVRTSQYLLQIVKCHDKKCCNPERSSYFSVISNRFMPPPIPIHQTIDGLKAPSQKENYETHKFPSIFINLSMRNEKLLSECNYDVLPYDYYCPSIQSLLFERICKKCLIYFASNVMLKNHMKSHRNERQGTANINDLVPEPRKIRPIRLAAKRQREIMAIIAQGELQDAEWINENDLDLTDMIIPPEIDESTIALPVISMEEHLMSPWEEEK